MFLETTWLHTGNLMILQILEKMIMTELMERGYSYETALQMVQEVSAKVFDSLCAGEDAAASILKDELGLDASYLEDLF